MVVFYKIHKNIIQFNSQKQNGLEQSKNETNHSPSNVKIEKLKFDPKNS